MLFYVYALCLNNFKYRKLNYRPSSIINLFDFLSNNTFLTPVQQLLSFICHFYYFLPCLCAKNFLKTRYIGN